MTCPHIVTSESTKVCPVCAEAAIAELQNALDFANYTLEDYRTERISLITSRDRLAAEVERLREAIEKAPCPRGGCSRVDKYNSRPCDCFKRAALAKEG